MIGFPRQENTFLAISGQLNSYGESLMKWWNCVNNTQMEKTIFPVWKVFSMGIQGTAKKMFPQLDEVKRERVFGAAIDGLSEGLRHFAPR